MSGFKSFHAERSFFDQCIRIHCADISVDAGGKRRRMMAQPPEWRDVELGLINNAPHMLRLTETEAQELMDALWSAGLRPTEGRGSAGAMAAVQEHLADMRRLVFGKEAK